ncbi:MAG: sigma-70 family RNA polymerase sigma factor [Armatimonadota bacterium]|nr:sigma-70 family RNA polymerase sigma factor [bacterium]
MISDEQIIELVLKKHIDEYQELVRRHQDSVFRLAYRILGRREEAEDVVQDTFVKAYSNLASCRERNKFWPWIRRIALNICLRRAPRECLCEAIDDLHDAICDRESPIEAEVLKQVDISCLRRAVAELPTCYRTIIVLRYEEELAYKEIAKLVGESVDVVRIRLYRAKKMLAQQLAVMNDEVC